MTDHAMTKPYATALPSMDRPVWVVVLTTRARRGRPAGRDVKYVRAATHAGAVRCARFHSYLPGRPDASARIATPQDLGCVPTTPEAMAA